jgi:anti-sigma regulatory factor (Ser/Thr protein kinase)
LQQTELEIGNRLDELGRATAWLEAFAGAAALPAETRYALDVGLNEAVTNVISYAYPDAAEHRILLRLERVGDAVWLEVEDDGAPFDPLQQAPPAPPTTLADAPIGGLGIHLIRSMFDECRYRRENGRNRLTLVARPPPRPAP